MLSDFTLNIMDTFNIVYLWIILTKRENNIFKLISSVVIISILITVTDQLGLNFIVTYMIDIIIIKIIYKRNFKNIIFELLLSLLIIMLIQLILFIVINKFVYDSTIQDYSIQSIILMCLVIFSKFNLLNKNFTIEKITSNILFYFILTSGIYIILIKFIWEYDSKIIMDNLLPMSVILCVLIVSQAFAYLYVVKVIKEKEALKVSNEYNSVINEIVQEIKQRQHDFVNYKNTIRGIVAVVDDKDVKSAINNYMKDEEKHDNKINELIYIDNIIIRSIIYRNICKAEKYNVNFEYQMENNVLDNILSYHEISNLLNNLLNNTFDEVLKEECDKKNIEVKIYTLGRTSHLTVRNQIVNSNNINLNEMFTRGYTTKNTAGTRGYGLYNVQKIVSQHKGYIEFYVEHETIVFDIYFNNSSGKSGSPIRL
jgi:Signal transduction histidine kinase regulating citrate/malate metabolism